MQNNQIAAVFEEIAELLEFRGENPFRVRAYRNSAALIRDYPEPLGEFSHERLTAIKGIGDDLAAKITSLAAGEELLMLTELRAAVPPSVLAFLRIPGLGPKKAAALHKELGLNTLDELRAACEAGKVRALKGFGAKTEETILHGLEIAAQAVARLLWCEADEIARSLREHFANMSEIEQLEFAGSYRRGKETVGDLDLLIVAADASIIMDRFGEFAEIAETIGRGDTKMSVRLKNGFQIDLRVVPQASFGAALQYFTGSKEHNVAVRSLAKQRGLKINEYGVFRVEEDRETYVCGANECDVYSALDLPLFPPEIRENRREFELAARGDLPRLVETSDLLGDLHMHTFATDGSASIRDMIAAAQARGLKYIAITDHSRRVSMARGLDPERLLAQWREIDEIRRELPSDFTLLKGIECDILEAGGMDLPDDVLAQADWVLASVHYGQKQPRSQITERVLGAIENRYVSAIAHPTGRLLNRREPYEIDLEAVYAACIKHRKLLELNANPLRLDLNDVHCAAAKSHGIPIVINTDAHSPHDLALMRYGVLQARRAGLTPFDIANARAWGEMKSLVGTNHE